MMNLNKKKIPNAKDELNTLPRLTGIKRLTIILLLAFSSTSLYSQNPTHTVLQTFWWDYWNNNYPNAYYNYLTELAPRLKDMGIEAIWIPPTSKASSGTNDVGYGMFDHYDLGDKYQKGNVRTRLGTKDEYLRMVAVMHANGIDVIQDIVLNHVSGAGPINSDQDTIFGKGGIDPNAPGDKWKNFRYTSYSRPATDESANDYLNRNGRWPKNYQNFHKSNDPTWGHNDDDYPQHIQMFGPDICYLSNAINTNGIPLQASTYGLASIFNPIQPSGYMKQQAIEWGVWLKKQTGIDGVRLDAAKHFEWDVSEAFLYNLQHGTGLYGSGSTWADGTDNMFAVSEYIPEQGQASMENFIDGVQGRTGTFDFYLRDGIYEMISGNGFYNISMIPGTQIGQSYRGRTVSFINNHDTFRPQLSADGKYTGWGSNELRPHIDPFNDRLPAAYAIICAVDGAPQVFFEDLFNIGGTGMRWTHTPTNSSELPARDHIANILWARRALNFASGAYKVRSAEAGAVYDGGSSNQDLLIIERSSKAIIGINDNGANWQGCWVDTDFQPGTTVKDYSGANGSWTYVVDNSKRVHISVPPADNQFGGYCIIAPVGFDGITFNPTQRETTQEWEMADDLGDSNSQSLKQGGAVPDHGFWSNVRTVGRIFSEAGKNIHLELYPTKAGKPTSLGLTLLNADGSILLQSVDGTGVIKLDYIAATTDYYTIQVYNAQPESKGQRVFVRATYTAPKVVQTSLYENKTANFVTIKSESRNTTVDAFPNPSSSDITLRVNLLKEGRVRLTLLNSNGRKIATLADGRFNAGTFDYVISKVVYGSGTYYYKLEFGDEQISGRIELLK